MFETLRFEYSKLFVIWDLFPVVLNIHGKEF
jgi:hypothetical protein